MSIGAKKLLEAMMQSSVLGEFKEWLKIKGLDDPFSIEIWMKKVFDILYEQFEEERKRAITMQGLSIESLERMLEHKKQAEAKKKKIVTPKKELVTPDGRKIRT